MIDHQLHTFNAISLKEMDSVKLMNRTDRKFCFKSALLPDLLAQLSSHYRVLEIKGRRLSSYQTLYYDTPDFAMYHLHHSGKLNRYKVRHRTYVESGLGFLEVKFKTNKGRTIKNRVSMQEVPMHFEHESAEFLYAHLPFNATCLVPVLWVNYSRITLVSLHSAERLTIDINLSYAKQGGERLIEDLVIAEVKQDRKTPSPFFSLMKQMRIGEGSISKYAMGIALMYKELKSNNFKSKINSILKLTHDRKHTFTGS